VRVALAIVLLAAGLLGGALSDGLASEPGPLVQQGAKLTCSEESGPGRFGRWVSLSGDGDTALVGAPRDGEEVGAAWVFARTGSTWTQQGPKLTGAGESGAGHFGRSVALSPDGHTALVGAPNDSAGLGAVWVFTRTGSTWTEQAKLTGGGEEGGKELFWGGVPLCADATTPIVGRYDDHDEVGAAWVFTRSGSTWTSRAPSSPAAKRPGGRVWLGRGAVGHAPPRCSGRPAATGGPVRCGCSRARARPGRSRARS
jgi:hypothetical protein